MRGRRHIRTLVRRVDALPRAAIGALLLGVFVAAHVVYYTVFGILFDARTLGQAWQFLDPALLRADLLRSVYYLHSQPPAFNLFVGIVLKLSPARFAEVFHAVFLVGAFALYLATFALLRALSVCRVVALPLTFAWLVSPAFLLYEHWLFYTFPVAILLAIAALALHRFLRGGGVVAAGAFFSLLLLVCTVWSAFHLVYFAGVVGVLAWQYPRRRATTLWAALLPAVLLGAVYVKNGLLFGNLAVNSWMGMSCAKVVLPFVPPSDLKRLVREGRISRVALVPPYSTLTAYPPKYRDPGRYRDVPTLSRLRNRNGTDNFNHVGFIAVGEQYLDDVGQALRAHPRALLDGTLAAFAIYAHPASDYFHLSWNRVRIPKYDAWFDRVVYLKRGNPRHPVYLSLLLGLPIVFLFGIRAASQTVVRAERGLLLFMLGTITYATLVFNLVELGENNRFRFVLDPFFIVLLGLLLQRTARWLRLSEAR